MLRHVEDDVVIHTYAYLPDGTPIRVVRHVEEEGDDIISVRFGDEGLVLEIAEGLLRDFVQVLERELRSADADT